MIVSAGLTSGQIQLAGLLCLAFACTAAFVLAFLLVAEARQRALGWWFACVAGLVAGSAAWATLVILRLAEWAPPQGVDLGTMLAGFVLAAAGGIGAMTVLAHRAGEWPRIVAGLLLGATLSSAALVVLSSGARIADIDAVVFVVATVCTLSAAAAAVLVSEMGLGRWRILAAALVLTLALFGAHYGGGRATAPQLDVSMASAVAVVDGNGVLGTLLIVLTLVGAVAAVAWGCICRRRRIETEDALSRAGEAALAQRVGRQLGPLMACLDLMSADNLPLTQRSRLDIARACAADLEALVAGAGALETAKETGRLDADAAVASGPCVLVVDEAIQRAVTGEMLRRLGARVALAAGASDAHAHLRASTFDLVLVNADMPGVDAFGLSEAIRSNPATTEAVVVGLSGNPAEDRAEAADCGMDEIVASPLTHERLADLLERWTDGGSGAAAAGDTASGRAIGSAGAQLLDLGRAKGARQLAAGSDRRAAIGEVAVGAAAR